MDYPMSEILDALRFDRDEYELDDGTSLRFVSTYDEVPVLDQWSDECYGRIAEVRRSQYTYHDEPRPDGFDGRAYKLTTRDGTWWWQPPADVTDDEQVKKMRRLVLDLLTEGFSVFGVVLVDEDGDVIDDAYIGGIEPSANPWDEVGRAYMREVIGDLVEEVLTRRDARREKVAREDAEHQHPWGLEMV